MSDQCLLHNFNFYCNPGFQTYGYLGPTQNDPGEMAIQPQGYTIWGMELPPTESLDIDFPRLSPVAKAKKKSKKAKKSTPSRLFPIEEPERKLGDHAKTYLFQELSKKVQWKDQAGNTLECEAGKALSKFLEKAPVYYKNLLRESPFFNEPALIIKGSFASLLLLLDHYEGDLEKALGVLGETPGDLDVTIPLNFPFPGTDPLFFLQSVMGLRIALLEDLLKDQENDNEENKDQTLPENFLKKPTYVNPLKNAKQNWWAMDRWRGDIQIDLQVLVQIQRSYGDLRRGVEVHVPLHFLKTGKGELAFRSANKKLEKNLEALENNKLTFPEAENLENGICLLARGITKGRAISKEEMLRLAKIFSNSLRDNWEQTFLQHWDGLYFVNAFIHTHWGLTKETDEVLEGLACLGNILLCYHKEKSEDPIPLNLSQAFCNQAIRLLDKIGRNKGWECAETREALLATLRIIHHSLFKTKFNRRKWRSTYPVGKGQISLINPQDGEARTVSVGHYNPQDKTAKKLQYCLEGNDPLSTFLNQLLVPDVPEDQSSARLAIFLASQDVFPFSSEEVKGKFFVEALDLAFDLKDNELVKEIFTQLIHLEINGESLEKVQEKVKFSLRVLKCFWDHDCYQFCLSMVKQLPEASLNPPELHTLLQEVMCKYGKEAQALALTLLKQGVSLPQQYLIEMGKSGNCQLAQTLFIEALPKFKEKMNNEAPSLLRALAANLRLEGENPDADDILFVLEEQAFLSKDLHLFQSLFDYHLAQEGSHALRFLRRAWDSFLNNEDKLKTMLIRILVKESSKGKSKVSSIGCEKLPVGKAWNFLKKLDLTFYQKSPWPFFYQLSSSGATLNYSSKTQNLGTGIAENFFKSWAFIQSQEDWNGESLMKALKSLPFDVSGKAAPNFFEAFLQAFSEKIQEDFKGEASPETIWNDLQRYHDLTLFFRKKKLLPSPRKAGVKSTPSMLPSANSKEPSKFFLNTLLQIYQNPSRERPQLFQELIEAKKCQEGFLKDSLSDYVATLQTASISKDNQKDGSKVRFNLALALHFGEGNKPLLYLGEAFKKKSGKTKEPCIPDSFLLEYRESILKAVETKEVADLSRILAKSLAPILLFLWNKFPERCNPSLLKIQKALLNGASSRDGSLTDARLALKTLWLEILPEREKDFPSSEHQEAFQDLLKNSVVQKMVIPQMIKGEKKQHSEFMTQLCRPCFLVAMENFPSNPNDWLCLVKALMLPLKRKQPSLDPIPNGPLLKFLESLLNNKLSKEASYYFSVTLKSLFWARDFESLGLDEKENRLNQAKKINERTILACVTEGHFLALWNALSNGYLMAKMIKLPINYTTLLKALTNLPSWNQEDPVFCLPEEKGLTAMGFSDLYTAATANQEVAPEVKHSLFSECKKGIVLYPPQVKSSACLKDLLYFSNALQSEGLNMSSEQKRDMSSRIFDYAALRMPDPRFHVDLVPQAPDALIPSLDRLIPLKSRRVSDHAAWMILLAKNKGEKSVEDYWKQLNPGKEGAESLKKEEHILQQAYFAARILSLGIQMERMFINCLPKSANGDRHNLPILGIRANDLRLQTPSLDLREKITTILQLVENTEDKEEGTDKLYTTMSRIYGAYAKALNFGDHGNRALLLASLPFLIGLKRIEAPAWALWEIVPTFVRIIDGFNQVLSEDCKSLGQSSKEMKQAGLDWLSSTKAFDFSNFYDDSSGFDVNTFFGGNKPSTPASKQETKESDDNSGFTAIPSLSPEEIMRFLNPPGLQNYKQETGETPDLDSLDLEQLLELFTTN